MVRQRLNLSDRRQHHQPVVLAACLLVLLTMLSPSTLAVAPTAPASPASAATPVASSPGTAASFSQYQITATFHPGNGTAPATLTGTETLHFVNRTGVTQSALYFRLYANAPEYAEGGMTIADLTVDGVTAATTLSAEDTVLRVPLPRALAVGQTADLQLAFTTTIPRDPPQSYGMFSYNDTTQTWALAHWYPVLAGWDPVSGWNLALWQSWGDAIFTTTSRYDVTLTTPAALTVAASGHLSGQTAQGDQTTRHYVSDPIRDFALVLGATLRVARTTVGQTTIASFFLPDNATGGAWALQSAAQAMAVYSRLFGVYPYADLAVVEVPLRDAAGVEFPQLVMIDAAGYRSQPTGNRIPAEFDFTVGHEVGHQWWFGLVGNDQYQHAFLDESLTNYSTAIYFEQQYGEAAADRMIDLEFKYPYFNLLFTAGDEVVDQPTGAFQGDSDYVAIIYGKGPLGIAAVRAAIGDKAFFAGLRLYLSRERFQVATPNDLLRAFENASGRDLEPLWHHWFDAADGRQDYTRQDFTELAHELGK